MSNQEIYDTVVAHLRTQILPSLDEDGEPMYRGPNGLKCSIGCLITDDEYHGRFEHTHIRNIFKFSFTPYSLIKRLEPHCLLLEDLQMIHDSYYPEEWEPQFRRVCEKFGLIYTPIWR